MLIAMACPINIHKIYFAPELAREQTIENLFAFGERLKKLHDSHVAGTARCDCVKEKNR